jgi:hypothetical protein
VTTPNTGGRDRYFTPETAIFAKPDPRAVREAVAAMQARAIPRQAVRETTLKLVQRDRSEFNAFIDGLREHRPSCGNDPRWTFNYVNNLYHWRKAGDFARQLGLALDAAATTGPRPWYAGDDQA